MSAPPVGVPFYDARAKPLSTTGQIQAGCYYQFYTTGTLSLANVYADGALSTPLSQTPVTGGTTAASDGRLPAIYLNPATIYRYQLYSSGNVLLEDIDPYVPPVPSNGLLNVTANDIQGFAATAGSFQSIRPDTSQFTLTFTGFSAAAPTCAGQWFKIGMLVVLNINPAGTAVTGTSNATSFTMTGVPSAIQPASGTYAMPTNWLEDNGTNTSGTFQINPNSGTITIFKGSGTTGATWTASGTKGIVGQITLSYTLI